MIRRWWKELSETVKELFLGILMIAVLVQVVCFLFLEDQLFYGAGLWIGVLTACFMAWHISYTLEGAVGMDGRDASHYLRKGYGIRFLLLILLILGIYYFQIGNVITFFLGVMTLKFSAYLQPVIRKIRLGISEKGRLKRFPEKRGG